MDNAYSWPDVQLLADGGTTPIVGVKAVEYTTEREHLNLHGAGHKPVEMAKGASNYSGSFTFLQSAIEALQAVLAPGQSITDAVYNFTVAYAPELGPAKADRLVAVRFTSVPKGIGTDNPAMEVVMPFIAGEIKYNV